MRTLGILTVAALLGLPAGIGAQHPDLPTEARDSLLDARLAIFMGEGARAVRTLKALCEAHPDLAVLHANLGFAYEAEMHTERAIAEYEEAVRLEPTDFTCLEKLGNVYADLRRYEEAITLLEKAVESRPGSAWAHANLGHAYQRSGRLAEAIEEAETAVRLDRAGSGDWPDRESRPEGEALWPDPAPRAYLLSNLGYYYLTEGRWSEGIRTLMEAYDLDWNYAQVLGALNSIGNEGISALARAVGENPTDPMARFDHAVALSWRQPIDHEPAHREIRAGLAIDPTCTDLLKLQGTLFARAGEAERAVAPLQRCIDMEPENWGCLSHLGGVLTEIERYDEARAVAERALAIRPDLPASHTTVAIWNGTNGNLRAAIASLESALEYGSIDAGAYYAFAWAYMELGDHENAMIQAQRARRLGHPGATGLIEEIRRLSR